MNEKIKKYTQIIIIILLLIASSLSVYLLITRKKIAYINNSVLISNSDIGKETKKILEAKIAEFQTEVRNRESRIEVLRDLSGKDPENITIKNELVEKGSAYEAYLREVDQQLTSLESELMTPVFAAINRALNEYGKKHRYSIILGATNSGNIVYGEEKLDITDNVLNYMNNMPSEE